MYWSSSELTPAIRHIAGRVLPASLRDLLPAPSGALLWGASPVTVIAEIRPGEGPEEVTLDGVVWRDDDPVVWLSFLTRSSVEATAAEVERLEGLGRVDLVNVARKRVPQSFATMRTPLDGEAFTDDLVGDWQWFLDAFGVFAATLVLAASEQVANVDEVSPNRRQVRRSAGKRSPQPVRVVRLNVAPSTGRHAGESEREYQHRWLVSGHWRSQPYGPGRTKRRLQLIAPYVKGPAGKPFAEPRPVVHHISKPPLRHVTTGEAA